MRHVVNTVISVHVHCVYLSEQLHKVKDVGSVEVLGHISLLLEVVL